jgi:hypothetical protein
VGGIQYIDTFLHTALSKGGYTMKTLSGPAELSEKERIRLQLNAQVEEFLRRGGAIDVVTGNTRPTVTEAGPLSDDDEELMPFTD